MLSISFIIPCYNGERFIFSNIKKFTKEIKNFKINYEIIIINDGSTDKTSTKLDKLQKIYKKIKFLHFKKNYGKSWFLLLAGFICFIFWGKCCHLLQFPQCL